MPKARLVSLGQVEFAVKPDFDHGWLVVGIAGNLMQPPLPVDEYESVLFVLSCRDRNNDGVLWSNQNALAQVHQLKKAGQSLRDLLDLNLKR